MNTGNHEQRDLTLLIFIIPIGIFLIVIVGQMAVRLVPIWSVNADMHSNLEPNVGSARPFALLEPILPQILTPMAWAESYLTPGAEISFPPFLSFEPSATPSAPSAAATTETPTASATPVPTGTSATASVTPPISSSICEDANALNYGDSLPCDYPSTPPPHTTCTDPLANNQGQALPCTYPPPPPVCPGANNPNGPLPCDYGDVSTVDTGVYGTPVSPLPAEIAVGGPPDNVTAELADATYIVISLRVRVESVPDNNYDLVLYEYNNSEIVYLDRVVVGISKVNTGSYYEVFNWGNPDRDTNTNVDTADLVASGDCPTNTECDDRHFNNNPASPAEPGNPNSLYNGTGILIDVDTASSSPPPGDYDFVYIFSPSGGSAGGTHVDAVQTVEVPTPPTP